MWRCNDEVRARAQELHSQSKSDAKHYIGMPYDISPRFFPLIVAKIEECKERFHAICFVLYVSIPLYSRTTLLPLDLSEKRSR